MKHLKTFETFIPKRIEDRKEIQKKIEKEKEKNLISKKSEIEQILKNFDNLSSEDTREQFLIDIFKGANVFSDYARFKDRLIFFDKDDKYLALFSYKWMEIYASEYYILNPYMHKFLLKNEEVEKDIQKFMKKYFGLEAEYVLSYTKRDHTIFSDHFGLRS